MVQADANADAGKIIEITHLREKKIFNLEEARALLPVVKKVTAKMANQVEALLKQLESADLENTEAVARTEAQANQLIEEWHDKMSKLGVRAKGLWYVDFDNGSNYFCWKYPESDIFFQHSYQDGFTGRTLIDKSRPLPKEIEGCSHGHHETSHDESEVIWAESRSRTDKLTPWRL